MIQKSPNFHLILAEEENQTNILDRRNSSTAL